MADDGAELVRRLESFRNDLMLLARAQFDDRLHGRLDPEDLVQQTLARAFECRGHFRGASDARRAAWPRTLLSRTLIDAVRKVTGHAEARRSLEAMLEQSSARLEDDPRIMLAGIESQRGGRAIRAPGPGQLTAAVRTFGRPSPVGWPTPTWRT
jgi:DNA-directed RNA polymerase specialized sigma24 family protein